MQLSIIQTAPASKYSGEVSEGEPFSDYYMELYDRQEKPLLGYNASDSVFNQKRVSKCDDKGNIVELAIYDNNGSLQNRIVCEYDDNDNISGFILYDSTNAVEISRIYEYDSEENMTEFRVYDSQGVLLTRSVSEYDSSGNMVESVGWDQYDNCDGTFKFDYDENGNVVKQDLYLGSDFSLDQLWERVKYNADGSVEESIHYYNGDGTVSSRQTNDYLQYDEHQNWTKCMLSKKVYGGTELFVQYRTIVYYGDGCKIDEKISTQNLTATENPTPTHKPVSTPEPTVALTQKPISSDVIVTFANKDFKDLIRGVIKKPDGDILRSELTQLTSISCFGGVFSDLSGIEHCINLKRLELRYAQISDLSPLSNLINLETLDLSGNQISDISPLSRLFNIEDLWLSGNQITDISPLLANKGIGEGDELYLVDNPLSNNSISIYIPQLEERGVEVYLSE